MADFRTKIFGLAGALLCTGMAYGQASCTSGTAPTNLVRVEGTTEQLGVITIACPSAAPIAAGGAATIQVFIAPALPVTSKLLSSSTGATEAVVTVNGAATQVNGTVSGSTISFSAILLTGTVAGPVNGVACATANCYYFAVSNLRVNATSLSVGTGTPPQITASAFISGSAAQLNPSAVSGISLGFAQNGLATSRQFKASTGSLVTVAPLPIVTLPYPGLSVAGATSGANNFVICTTIAAATATIVQVGENFASAFKDVSAPGPGSENSGLLTTLASNAVLHGTRIQLNFSGVPTNVTVYVPVGVIPSIAAVTGGVSTIQLTAAAPGTAFAAVTGTTNAATLGALSTLVAPVSLSGGVGTATFQVTTTDTTNLDAFNIPVYIVAAANTVAGSATAMTITTNLAPVGATTIPNFASGASSTTLTASKFNLCTTSLLLPFVTNQLGFDTGIAIANTSSDPFGTAGATPQAGTCTLSFYGNGAPTPNNITTANIPTGTVYAAPLSSIAAGFQGYAIAQCSFQFAHGFVFVTNGVGPNGGLSQGYLAGVIPDINQTGGRAANPLSAAAAGTGETLGQ